jgi:flagellar protein FlbD
MIRLTSFDGREVIINALLVEKIEAVPDTVVTLTTGNSFVVRESADRVIEQAVDYLRSLRVEGDTRSPATAAQWGRIIR